MDFSPAFSDVHSHQSDLHSSPMSLPPSATPRSVAPKEESYTVNMDTLTHQYPPLSSRITTNMGPPPSVSSYHPNSVAPSTPFSAATPYTPRPADVSHLQPSLQNIVSTVNLGCPLDLKRIALQARNAEYNPKRFAAVIMRIRNPRTTALIFGSGKMVCTGAKSEEDSLQAARRYARVIQKLGFPAKFRDFKIQNMVGSVDVKFPIRLEALVLKHYQFCSYEPELFPGLIYRMMQPKIVLLIFVSGKVVLTGAKVRREIHEAFELVRSRGTARGRGRGRGRGSARGTSRGSARGTSRGRGRGAARGGRRGGSRTGYQRRSNADQQQATPIVDLDINNDPKPFFVNASVTLDQHIQAQTSNLPRYLATLFSLDSNSVEIGQKAKACALAAAWCRHDHKLANNLLRHRRLFTLTEVLKAVTMLDAARQIRVYEKKLKRLELSKTKTKAVKLGKIKNNIDNLNKLKPTSGSASGAVARHIQRWTKTLTKQELEYFALHMPTEPWKKLADIVHFHPEKDFPELPWFLPFCFGSPAPAETMVARCRDITNENVNDLLKEFSIPYSHLKQFKEHLNEASKAKIAAKEDKLDTILWYYEDLQCSAVDEIISERLREGEQITLPYGKLMERLLLCRMLRDGISSTAGRYGRRSETPAASNQPLHPDKAKFYPDLLPAAQAQLEKIKLPLESPVAVIGDASGSMEVAIRTATILSSLLTAICSAKLNFFNDKVFEAAFVPKTLEDVLSLALVTKADGSTANAAGLVPYYDAKEVIKTFVMVTDEEENANGTIADGSSMRFFELFMKYRAEVYPAKLVFISFLSHQHAQGEMYSQFQNANVPDVLQFKFNRERPDLTKIDNLLGVLSTGSSASFDTNLEPLQAEFQQNGIEAVITRLIEKQDENSMAMDIDMGKTTAGN
ncbi:unnamed protein product [Rotaria socialis]|uniref:Uncharacterized protein n=3 Tax=Philodinida TaxID=104783 RepID=A0A821FZP4_9BILA|nr:unnamed protein product [Rotaria socialis]CAF3703234.1 unnamed protein product [Rotaria socialis]CAF4240990.1 unnamed protein product [Rotaria socialis]CAF4658727.1 unnamed protein product [Rotaria socialis]